VAGFRCLQHIESAVAVIETSPPDVFFLDCASPLAECWDALAWSAVNHATVCMLLGVAADTPQVSLPLLDYLQRPIKLTRFACSLDAFVTGLRCCTRRRS